MSRRNVAQSANHYDVIAAAIQEMPVVNSHEHCWRSFSRTYGQEYDLAYFLYVVVR